LSSSDLPSISAAQVKLVDELCAERFGISTEWLMEAAGWQVARFIGQPAAVVCGVGNNAGDGLAAARHLHRWGRLASVACVDAMRLRGPAAAELDALRRVGVHVSEDLDTGFAGAQVIVDAIFGTGLTRAPEGRFGEWIEAMNAAGKSIVSIDVPSGVDADTGEAYAPAVRASVTVTLGLPKPALSRLAGRVLVADIGVPLEAYTAAGIDVPNDLYSRGELIKL
jgi:NAD(P)H-hydrate epimerase